MSSKLLTALTIVLNKSRKLRAVVIPFLSASTNLAMNWRYQEVITLIAFACSCLYSSLSNALIDVRRYSFRPPTDPQVIFGKNRRSHTITCVLCVLCVALPA